MTVRAHRRPEPGQRGPGRRGLQTAAADLPVARVWVDVPLSHLDRPFDYLVPDDLAAEAVPGCRVRVRFAGRRVDGFVVARLPGSEHEGRLQFLGRVVSPEPVLSPEVAALARAVADRYAGLMADVLRLAVPPRHARVEAEPPPAPPHPPPRPPAAAWGRYPRGAAFLDAVVAGRAAHAVWQVAPGEDWPRRLAEAATTAASAGRGALLVLPDYRDVERVHAACVALAGPDACVALTADLGPARRYRRWLAVRRGIARVVVGTRAAMFAPVADPGLLVVWDDGDDLHAEPRAPYPHVREVLVQRAHATGAALLCAGFARTAEAQLLVDSGWAHEIVAPRAAVREAAPRVTAIGDDAWEQARDPAARSARLPLVAVEAARAALAEGAPVLVQVPRGGYVPALACGQCRSRARCRRCAGPLALPAGEVPDGGPRLPACRWCGTAETSFVCPACGSRRLRAVVVGAARTAEELGRAFPGVPVRTSGGAAFGTAPDRPASAPDDAGSRAPDGPPSVPHGPASAPDGTESSRGSRAPGAGRPDAGAAWVLASVPARRALVVCTPGAEPVAEGGYGAALLLDGWALLARPDLRATEETLRRWITAAALVRPASSGGRVVVVADSALAPVQALVRWDPAWHAAAELAARTELGFPPAVRLAAIDGTPAAVADLVEAARLPATAELLGPVPLSEGERLLVRVPRSDGRALAAALAAAQAVRTARKAADPVRVQLDAVP